MGNIISYLRDTVETTLSTDGDTSTVEENPIFYLRSALCEADVAKAATSNLVRREDEAEELNLLL